MPLFKHASRWLGGKMSYVLKSGMLARERGFYEDRNYIPFYW